MTDQVSTTLLGLARGLNLFCQPNCFAPKSAAFGGTESVLRRTEFSKCDGALQGAWGDDFLISLCWGIYLVLSMADGGSLGRTRWDCGRFTMFRSTGNQQRHQPAKIAVIYTSYAGLVKLVVSVHECFNIEVIACFATLINVTDQQRVALPILCGN